mmetsp:Transcript_16488/g.39823  ORF Transcript_16488/g.39823 Transcript_16488/m.39823 type:complete len:228 (+) Transcript_16488:179-862(+)
MDVPPKQALAVFLVLVSIQDVLVPHQVHQLARYRNLVRELLHQVQHPLVLPDGLLRGRGVFKIRGVVPPQLLDQPGQVQVVRAVVRRARAVGVAGREGGDAHGLPGAVGGAEEALRRQAAGRLGALDGRGLALVPLVAAAGDALAGGEGQGLGWERAQLLNEDRCFRNAETLRRRDALLRCALQRRRHIRHRRPLQLQRLEVHEGVGQAELPRQRVCGGGPVAPQER